MPEPTAMLQAVRASTADLLKGLDDAGWSDADLRKPSLCDGWTRAHVLSHLARNADATAATLSGALRGEVVRRYPGGTEQRAADIEAGVARPFAALVADLAESAERLDRVFGAVSEAGAWEAQTDDRLARDWPPRRLCELELHRVDLDDGYSPRQWPPVLVADLLPQVAASISDRLAQPLRVVVAETDGDAVVASLAGQAWGESGGEAVTLPDWALLAWLTDRGAPVADLLVGLPALTPWGR